VRQLIMILIEQDMDKEVFVRDLEGNRIKAHICCKPQEGLTCLFG
jgi:hypothetical protein